ncbi:uncharacterized protein MONBRDRAFT_32489 [Monosiga brevicollis MX1]|uniref:Protein HGH1 homolog n=1 Tax=Monosiga brevicollis TaxID=81824 RepID=A9UZU4_MONBE|nr:uncharacterized protein MONBRDRAFT_32489 [Monosiga brevicollis MX1]EDQ89296.1 predicted protein [Monosiga brevicollis MX1]|eukprot:XP_001745872.1 hypothetical protein [Monosiga brevicollis MX1]
MADEVSELLGFMSLDTRLDVRSAAVDLVLGLTVSQDKNVFFKTNREFVPALCTIVKEDRQVVIVKDAVAALINLAHDEDLASIVIREGIVEATTKHILDPEETYPDPFCLLLVNLTRHNEAAERLCHHTVDEKPVVHELVRVFCLADKFNENGNLDHLANVLFNITQTSEGRRLVMARTNEGCVIQRLLPFTQYVDSRIRRGGVIGALRNCCFEYQDHEWLLSPEVDLLPYLLLPLAGPEEFDDEDMDGMPDDLQYLPPDKKRDMDADIRMMLLEALLQLAATRGMREQMRRNKVYPILREYHKWEPLDDVRDACEQVVQLLINEEHDLAPNLHEVNVDPTIAKKLDEIKEIISSGQGPEVELVPEPERPTETARPALEDAQ